MKENPGSNGKCYVARQVMILLYAIPSDSDRFQLINIKRESFRSGQEYRWRNFPEDALAIKIESDSLVKIDTGTVSNIDLRTSD